jgi:hypothetical protein
MGLNELTRESVVRAAEEYDDLGRDTFLQTYGFSPARQYFLVLNGRRYDSKAVAGAAHRYALPSAGPLRPADFSGGDATVARVLRRLGFDVAGGEGDTSAASVLAVEGQGQRNGFHRKQAARRWPLLTAFYE